MSKATCSFIPSTDIVSVSGTGAVYRGHSCGHDGLVKNGAQDVCKITPGRMDNVGCVVMYCAMACCAILYYDVICCAMLCYAMLCCTILCFVLFYVLLLCCVLCVCVVSCVML